MIKPVYGFLSDAVPIYGYRRCSYLAICGLLGGRQAAGSWQRGIPLPLLARRGCMLARLHARAAAPASDVPHAGAQHACSSDGAVPSMLIPPPEWPLPAAGFTAWSLMATVADSPASVVALLLMGSAATACADVVADSVVVELVRRSGGAQVGHPCGCYLGRGPLWLGSCVSDSAAAGCRFSHSGSVGSGRKARRCCGQLSRPRSVHGLGTGPCCPQSLSQPGRLRCPPLRPPGARHSLRRGVTLAGLAAGSRQPFHVPLDKASRQALAIGSLTQHS